MDIYYVNSASDKITLSEWPIAVTDIAQLYGRKWNPTATENTSKNRSALQYLSRVSKEFTLDISIYADSANEYLELMNNFESVTDYDVRNNSPGRLYVGEYYLECFIRDTEPSEYEELFFTVDNRLTVYSINPHWIKETKFSLLPQDENETQGTGLDYPYDYAYDFSANVFGRMFENDAFMASNFTMTIWGYADTPVITIAGHAYAVNVTIESGQRVVIDSRYNTVVLIDKYGNETNIYNSRNKTQSVFEAIPPGFQIASWTGSYGVDITLYDERSEPKWIS